MFRVCIFLCSTGTSFCQHNWSFHQNSIQKLIDFNLKRLIESAKRYWYVKNWWNRTFAHFMKRLYLNNIQAAQRRCNIFRQQMCKSDLQKLQEIILTQNISQLVLGKCDFECGEKIITNCNFRNIPCLRFSINGRNQRVLFKSLLQVEIYRLRPRWRRSAR